MPTRSRRTVLTPRKSEAQQKADRRRMDMWQEYLTDIDPETIDPGWLRTVF